MARVRRTNQPPTGRRNIAGRLVVRQTEHGYYAQKWPKPAGPTKRPSDRWWRATWGTAAQMASHPNSLDQEFAEAWAENSPFAPRDFLTAAALGTLFEITLSDGTTYKSLLKMTGNPQSLLDLITNVPGAMLLRRPDGWHAIPPGNIGDLLEFAGPDNIRWRAPDGPPLGEAAWTTLIYDVQPTTDWTTHVPLRWQTALEDPLNTWDPAAGDELLTAPPNAARVQLHLSLIMNGTLNTGPMIPYLQTRDDPASPWTNVPHSGGLQLAAQTNNTVRLQQIWRSIPITAGNQIRAILWVVSDTNVEVIETTLQAHWT